MVKTVKKSKAQKKTFVLDTNVLLSDSESLLSFQDNNVVLPLIVIEELDRHKDRQDDTGKNAREVSRKLIELVRVNKNEVKSGIKLGKNLGTLRVLNQKDLESNVVISIPELDGSKGDNKIIQFCLEFKQKFNDERLILVTRDLLLRIKAISVGIECEDYKKLSKELLVSMNMPASEEEFYTGIKTIKVTKEEMDAIYSSGDLVNLKKSEEQGLYPNQFVVFECEETNVKWAGRYIEPGKPLKKVPFQRSAWGLKSRNMEQAFLLDLLLDDKIKLVTISSKSGAGKTLLSLSAALEQTLTKKKYSKILITRNVQPMGKDIGYLPGPVPLYTKVLTPTGWTTMGELKVGSSVIAKDGTATKVTGVYPKGKKEILKITFEDGAVAECCEDHPWSIYLPHANKKSRVWSTKQIEAKVNGTDQAKSHNRISIDLVEPVEYNSSGKLPIHPYILGAVLGDGCVSQKYATEFSTNDIELVDRINGFLPDDITIKNKSGMSYSFTMKENLNRKGRATNSLNKEINKLGLRGANSSTKFIPEQYMFSSIKDRLFLLQGLMDTDGYVSADGSDVSLTTVSKQLAYNFRDLVLSLGGFAKVNFNEKKFNSYTISVSFTNPKFVPFLLQRKANRYKSRKYNRRRRIDAVERTGKFVEMRCISVAHHSHLYVMNDFIVTHNTMEEKLGPWLAPFKDNLEFLLNENLDDALDKGATASKKKNEVFKNTFMMQDLFEKGIIQMEATTFIRGRSIPNCFFIIDEVQNMNLHEIKTVLTRAGEGTKIILLGDPGQIDNTYVNKFSNGLTIASEKFKRETIAGHIMLVHGERSELANTAATIFDT